MVIDADGLDTIESYVWSGEGLDDDDDGGQVRWTAPEPDQETDYTLTVTVTDDQDETATATATVTVTIANSPPTVTLTADRTSVRTSETVRLTATVTDTDGLNTIASYVFNGEGTFGLRNGSEIDWTAPSSPTQDTDYTLTVTVTDLDGASGSDTVTISVEADVAPTVELEASRETVAALRKITLTARAVDPNGLDTLEYEWDSGGSGTFQRATDRTKIDWIAPSPSAETEYTLGVTVTDDRGATANDSVTITVEPQSIDPARPVVTVSTAENEVRLDTSVNEGESVDLFVLVTAGTPEEGASVGYSIGTPDERALGSREETCSDYEHVEGRLDLAREQHETQDQAADKDRQLRR